MKTTSQFLGKFAYAIIFLLVIPTGLILWANHTEHLIIWPVIGHPTVSWVLMIIGVLLMMWGMLALFIHGKGLPMNAYPPPVFVQQGPYKIVRHPIYWGFAIALLGFFMLLKSASGIWLVTPITILGMIALVWGYEQINLAERFPKQTLSTIFDFPTKTTTKPAIRERLAVLFVVSSLLILCNFLAEKLVGHIAPLFGEPLDALFNTQDLLLPVISLIFLFAIPFLIQTKAVLRQWAVISSIALGLNICFSILIPSVGAQYLLQGELVWFSIPIFLWFISVLSIWKESKGRGIFIGILTLFIGFLQLAYSRSLSLHFIVSMVVLLIAFNYMSIWEFVRRTSEKIANSWQEWIFGNIRIINHGFYVGFGAFLAILMAGILAGPSYAWAILVFAITVIVFSALWAQIIEGSEKLKRPFGYYGALVGIVFASLIVWAMGANIWVIIGVISVVMPWTQAIGRLRCLINGCCHGSRVDNPEIGIRYFHHRSRVCHLSHLKGELLHPTPLYSILWLFIVGFVLLAFWLNHLAAPFIFGMYLILTGLGRFVEEAYRGEVQTPIIKGLRLYQWTAILSVLIGIIMTTIQVNLVVTTPSFSWEIGVAAGIGGLFTCIAMGVDFPYSNMRFSRLV